MGGFEQISIQDGDRLYTSRNAGFTPIRIRELTGLIHFAGGPEGLAAKKLKQRVENGISMNCLQVIHQNFKGEPHEVCVNATSHDILSEEWHEKPDELRREQFMDYSDFGGHRYPRELQLQVNGSRAITVTITSLTTATFDEGLLTPPKGAIERRQCADLKHAVPVKTPDPMYPKSASQNKLMGDVAVAMTVLTDGSVTDIQLIGGAAHSMDDATLQTLKGWKFKPATCGTEPIVSDIEVIVSFRLD